MAITQAICNSFKVELLTAIHNFTASTGDTFKIALFTSAATLGENTTAYTTAGEITGTNYTAGGVNLTSITPTLSGSVGVVDFTDAVFSNVTVSGVRGALIYNSSKANRAVAVLDFGSDRAAAGSNFTVIMPAADATNSIIRVQ